ncbi:hypothetical protein [Aeromonas jandaei]|uniref:hypothetical protein n=1 Tax=Aeromonas jandaei TaxID=650 RepID=UPI003B9F6966
MNHSPFYFNARDFTLTSEETFLYRLQKIVSYQQGIIGYEVLLDFAKAQASIPDGLTTYKKAINDGSALNYLLTRLIKDNLKLFGSKLFINVERINLCNKTLLRKINLAAKSLLQTNQVELVVEITERNPCGYCANIMNGLVYLKRSEILLAADDFDIYGDDFRRNEVNIGLYDFIKVIMPKSVTEAMIFNRFVSERSEKIIVEMVEEHHALEQWKLSTAYGYQGFAYG